MSKFFVPFNQDEPAAVEINGHRLLLVASSEDELTAGLREIGGSEVREIELSPSNEESVLRNLANTIHGGIVLTPPGVRVATMLSSLKAELPWVH